MRVSPNGEGDATKMKNYRRGWQELKRMVAGAKRAVRRPWITRRSRMFAAKLDDICEVLPGEGERSTSLARTGALENIFDATLEGPGIWKWRHYFEIYERHLSRFRGSAPQIAEVGVFSGGSILMWHKYFGEGTRVHGIDIDPRCRTYSGPQTDIHIGDQADPTFWQTFRRRVPHLDVLIDDGGHLAHQQICTFEQTFPHLAPGGVFICEDIHGHRNLFSAYIEQLISSMHAERFSIGRDGRFPTAGPQGWIEAISVYPYMVVIEKRRTRLDTLESARVGTEWQPAELPGSDGRLIAGRGGASA